MMGPQDMQRAIGRLRNTYPTLKLTEAQFEQWSMDIHNAMSRRRYDAGLLHAAVEHWCNLEERPPRSPKQLIDVMGSISRQKRENASMVLRKPSAESFEKGRINASKILRMLSTKHGRQRLKDGELHDP